MSDRTKRTLRTLFQVLLALAAALPVIVDAAGIPRTAAGVGIALAVAGAITRAMASPMVQRFIPRWLRLDADQAEGGK